MRRWELSVALDQEREQPLFLQLASAIADDIRRGRLRPGEPLPGSRELAELLGVNRNTIVAGYGELVAEGLVNTRVGGGTFVAGNDLQIARGAIAANTPEDAPTYALTAPLPLQPPKAVHKPGTLILSRSVPDVRLFPTQALTRAFRRAIGRRGRMPLTYTNPAGHPRLRAELATMLSRTRGLMATPDNLIVTRSIEQGIDLVARALLAPGDGVVVERFSYPPARSVMKLAGARLIPVAVDEQGLNVDEFENVLARETIRAVFLTPHHQFPTTTVMTSARRARLAELALRHRFAIIEDDYDHELHYEGKPILPIAAGAGRGNVVYIGSLANLLTPGFSTAFVVAPPAVIERLISFRAASDAQGDAAVECAIAELFEDGELLRHVRRMRRVYLARRDALAVSLKRHLGSAIEFRVPEGGMALWAHVDESIDTASWTVAGEREGVVFSDARMQDCLEQDTSHMRLGYSFHDEAELDEAARRMARALMRARKI
jgi:GntR family transcriptional regulator/MocR family aminotransferase